jgi:hypothetical protein
MSWNVTTTVTMDDRECEEVELTEPEEGCCHPDCEASDTPHSILLMADMEGMVADWGDVAFCSAGCARRFFDEYHAFRHRRTIIHWEEPVLATIERKGVAMGHALGHSLEAATTAAVEQIGDDPTLGVPEELGDHSISYEVLG